ncbi:uncharacterized protein [Macrobrachium rosenbergii]|uniref:uncharacterized protein n=1 Tax=Macrobrachium rosenbergii TaxID=79674 RepID=UPI0034D3CD6F
MISLETSCKKPRNQLQEYEVILMSCNRIRIRIQNIRRKSRCRPDHEKDKRLWQIVYVIVLERSFQILPYFQPHLILRSGINPLRIATHSRRRETETGGGCVCRVSV